MLVWPHQRQSVRIKRAGICRLHVEKDQRQAARLGRRDQSRYIGIWIEAQQRVVRAERVIERAAVVEPQMRGAAAGHS
jgi:hypothetical protein